MRTLAAALVACVLLFAASGSRADEPVEAGEHAEEKHGAGHVPHFDDINWFYGLVGEKDDLDEPTLLFRKRGMPPPLGALLLNAGVLFGLLYHYGRLPIAEALKRRRRNIMHGMEEAARMREEAEDRLEDYEDKLERIDEEIKRVKREMRELGEQERERILKEARERHTRMERDALLLVEQELKEARELLLRETVRAAIRAAEERLAQQVTAADQQRLGDEYLAAVKRSASVLGGSRD
jgi:F-type H+-transporting ATPase subunit b